MVEKRRILAMAWGRDVTASCCGEREVAGACGWKLVDARMLTGGRVGEMNDLSLGDGTISKSWRSCGEDILCVAY